MTSLITLSDGKRMPIVGLGTWKCTEDVAKRAVTDALDAGYTHFDCAHCYNNERAVGEGLQAAKRPREELYVTSKLWNTKHRADQVVGALRHTLAQLNLDYVDLYLIHWPLAFAPTELHSENFPRRDDGSGPVYDFELSFCETWRGMEEAHALGLAKSIGLSNFNSKQIDAILAMATVRPVVNQVECHPLLPQKELLSFCRERGIALVAYSPLGSPDATGRKADDPSLLTDGRILAIGRAYGRSAAAVLVRFQTQRGIAAIPKSKTKEYLADNLAAGAFDLSDEHLAELEAMGCGYRFGGCTRDSEHPLWPFNEYF